MADKKKGTKSDIEIANERIKELEELLRRCKPYIKGLAPFGDAKALQNDLKDI